MILKTFLGRTYTLFFLFSTFRSQSLFITVLGCGAKGILCVVFYYNLTLNIY